MKTKDEVLILYVNDFKAKTIGLELEGHLQKGRIYLCLKHEEKEEPYRTMYRIFFDDTETSLDGIFIQSLDESNESWECKLEELDLTKLEKYRLSDNDVNYAIDIKNMTLDEVRAKVDSKLSDNLKGKTVFERLDESIVEEVSDLKLDDIERIYNETLETLSDDENNMKSKNNLKDVFDDVVEYINTTIDDKYEDSMINPMDMLMSKEHGKTINIFNTIKYLSRYSTDGFEKSNNINDLMKAIHYILIEMNRVKTNLK